VKIVAFAVALALVGCASTPGPVVPVEVQVPVSVPCRVPDIQRPAFAVDSLSHDADVWDMIAALRAERLQRRGYEAQLEAALKSCQASVG